jgi:hypothetical protein
MVAAAINADAKWVLARAGYLICRQATGAKVVPFLARLRLGSVLKTGSLRSGPMPRNPLTDGWGYSGRLRRGWDRGLARPCEPARRDRN